MGDRHDQSAETAPCRRAPLRRAAVALGLLAVLATLWVAGGRTLLRQAAARDAARLAGQGRALEAVFSAAARELEREASLLAREPSIIEGVTRGDWATLARGASPRLLSLTRDRLADLVLVLDASHAPLMQVPATPRVDPESLGPLAPAPPGVRVVAGQPHLVTLGPVRGPFAETAAEPVGLVILARRLDDLQSRLAPLADVGALVVVAGDSAVFASRPEAPTSGWSAARAAGAVTVAGRTWPVVPTRVPGVVALVAPGDGWSERQRTLAWLAGSFAVAAAGVLAAVALAGRRRAASPVREAARASGPAAEAVPAGPTARAFIAECDLAATAEEAVEVARGVARVDAGALFCLHPPTGTLFLVAHRGLTYDAAEQLSVLPLDESAPAVAYRSGRVVVIETDGPRAERGALAAVAAQAGHRVHAAVPIPVNGAPWGVLLLAAGDRRQFDHGEIKLLEAVAHQIGLAVARDALVAESREKGRRLETLARLAQTLTATLSPTELQQAIVDAAVELFSVEARLWLVEEDGLVLRATAGGAVPAVAALPSGEGLIGAVVTRRAPVAVADVAADPRAHALEIGAGDGRTALAAVPLALGDRVLGALAIAGRERPAWLPDDVALLQSLGDQAAIAIGNAGRFSNERADRVQLEALLEITKRIGARAPTEELLTWIAEEAARLLDVDNAGFRLLEGDELVLAGLAGTARDTMTRRRIRADESLSGKILRENRALIVDLDTVGEITIPEHRAAERRLGYTTFLGVPLRVADRTIGCFAFRARRPFTERDAELAQAFADQAAVAIENGRLIALESARRAEREARAEIEREVTAELNLDRLLSLIVGRASRLVQGGGAIYLLEASGDLAAVAWSERAVFDRRLPLGVGLIGVAGQERRGVIANDYPRSPFALPKYVALGVRHAMAYPLVIHDRLLGVIGMFRGISDDPAVRAFGADDLIALESFAAQAAVAIENARLHEEAQQRRREAEELARLSGTLTESLDASAVGDRVVESAVALFGVQMSCLRLARPDGTLVPVAWAGGADAASRVALPPGLGLAGRAVAAARPVQSADVLEDPALDYGADLREQVMASPWRAALAVPLRAKGQIIGALVLIDHRGRVFSEAELGLAQAFGDQAALALENARLHGETERRRRQAEALARVASRLTGSLDVSTVAERIISSVPALLGMRTAGLRLLEEDGSLRTIAYGGEGTPPFAVGHVLPPGAGIAGAAVAGGGPTWTSDLLADRRYTIPGDLAALLQSSDYRAFVSVPLRVKGAIIGTLTAADAVRDFSADEIAIFQTFADQAALALENARLHDETERRRREAEMRAARLRTLARVNQLVSSTLDPEEVLSSIARAAAELTGTAFVSFWVADPATGTLEVRAFSDEAIAADLVVRVVRVGQSGIGWVAAHRQTLNVADVFADDAVIVNHAWWRERGFRSFLGVPVVLQDTLLAVLALNGREPFELSRDDSELLESFAAQAAIALSNARVYREARQYGERLRALEEVNRTVSSSLQMDEVLRSIAGAVARFFDAPQVSIWVFDPATSRLRLSLSFGDLRIADELTQELGLGEGLVGWAVQHREPVLWTDLEHDMRAIDSPRMLRRGFRYCTAYPIAIGDRVLGGFAMWRAEPSVVNFETLSLLGSLAAQAAVALDHARLFAETAQRLEQSRALLGVTEILSSTLDSTPLLKRVTIKIAQVCGVDRCSLELWDGDRGRPLMSQFADGRPRPELWKAFRQSESGAPRVVPAHLQAIETHRPVVIDDTAATDLIPQEWVHTFGLKSYMVVPLIRQGTVIGVMNLDHCERVTPFAAWQADLALAIAGHLALALENARLYGEARERLRETTTLLAVGHALSQPAPIDQRLRAVAREVGRIFGADMVGVYVVDDARTVLSPITGYHVPRRLVRTFVERPFVLARMPELFDDWRQGRPVWSTDVKNDARFDRETFESLDSHAMLCAPTRVRGESVGAIFLVWWQPGRQVQPAEIRLLEGVAQQVGLAMENAELVRQTERRLHETETLLSVSRELSSTLDVQTLLRHFLRSVARALGAETVGVWMLDDDGETLLPHSAYRVPPEHLETLRHIRLSLHEGLGEEAARTKRPIASEDFAADARVPESIRAAVPVRSQILVPIVARERLIGAFTASWWTHPRRFTADELALLEAIATQAGVAVENARLFEANRRQVEELSALHDLSRAVTGQLDRAALLDAVGQRVCQILEVDTMTLLLVSEGNDDFEVALRLRDGMRDETVPMRYPVSAGLMSAVLREGHAIRTARYQAECARRGVAPVERVSGMPHWLGVPLVAGDRVLGVLAVSSRHRPFSATDERLLTNIGGLVALALRSARLFEERTRALDELAAAQDQLVRTEKLRALGEMASGVAHDFNNLLSAILGRAQLLLGRVEEPSLRRWLQVIERSAQDGAQTVRRLQEFTRIRRDAPMVEVDLNDVVRDALEMTQSRWREEALRHGVSLEVRSALAPLPPVAGDPAELREAMTNLILNAVDAMPGGGRLTITSAVVDGDIEVAVADNGVGMSDEVRQRIFDPFFTTKGPQGTGLGLSMTYGILSRHGARVTVDSERDRGTIFRLRFTPRAARGTVPGEPPAPGGGRGPLRCLVVDDEEAVGQVIGDVLETIGHGVVVMTDGRAAIERFGAERFDVVFTDLAMPGVSGWDVARAVKAAAPEVTVFLVSGFGVELSEEERRSHGVDAVFAKPLKIEQIMDAMARVRLRGGLRHSSEGRSAPLPNPPPES